MGIRSITNTPRKGPEPSTGRTNHKTNTGRNTQPDPLFTKPLIERTAFVLSAAAEIATPLAIYQYYGTVTLLKTALALLTVGILYFRKPTTKILQALLAPFYMTLFAFMSLDALCDMCSRKED